MGHDQHPSHGGTADGSAWDGAGSDDDSALPGGGRAGSADCGAAPGSGARLDVETALELMAEASRLGLGSSIATLSPAQKRAVMEGMVRQRAANEAFYLHVLSQFDSSPGVVPGVRRRIG